MPSTGSKRKSNNNSDVFKTRKAKVGKKVARGVEDTDVKFKAASLYVSGQAIENNTTALLSSRGKSLSELLNTLQTHPAVKARCSAGKGVNDILGKNSDVAPYISAILPALLQASNSTESDELRSVAVEGIGLLMAKNNNYLLPFTKLMHARIASALNSLDRQVRLTGVVLVKICCGVLQDKCASLLPPFISLLTEHASHSENITKVLTSLTALLKAVCASSGNNATSTQQLSVDLKYVEGGRSRNAVLLPPRPRRRSVQALLTLTELPVVREIVGDVSSHQMSNKHNNKKQLDTDTALLSKLFDCLMECTGVGGENGDATEVDPTNTTVAKGDTGNKKSTADASNDNTRILLVLQAIRWLHAYHNDAENIDFKAMQKKMLTFLMEQLFGNTSSTIDLAICSTVLHVLKSDNANKRWRNVIRSSIQEQINTNQAISEELLDVVCLLVESDTHEYAFETLELLRSKIDDLKSSATRHIILLAMNGMWTRFRTIPPQYVELATKCLQAWDIEYLYENESILEVLSGYVRRTDVADLHNVRDGMAALFEALSSIFERYPEPLQRMALGIVVMAQQPSDVMLKNMAAICARNEDLASIIMESVHSIRKTISMGAYTTFLINTVAMPKRVKALQAANRKANRREAVPKVWLSVDAPLSRMAKLLLSSGPPAARILEMIQPQLDAWQKSAIAMSDMSPLEHFMKMRACFVLQAFFLLAMKQQAKKNSIEDSLPSSVTVQALQGSICTYLYKLIADSTPAVAMANANNMLSPIVAIMVAIPALLEPIVQRVGEWFQLRLHHLSRQSQTHVLHILTEWFKDERLRPILKDPDALKAISAHIAAIGECESVTDNETALQLLRDLTGQLELVKVL